MRPASQRLIAALRLPHRLATEARILQDGDLVTALDVADGSVTLDQTAAIRGRCDVTLADDGTLGLVPDSATHPLAPYGNEIQLLRGVAFPDQTSELVSLGIFRLEDVEIVTSATGLAIRVVGLDRAARMIDARLEEPYEIAPGTNYVTAITQLLQAGWPGIPTNFTATTRVTPALRFEEGDDRWDRAQEMAESIGMDVYFDGDGVCVLVPSATLASGTPVATLAEGADGVLVDAARRWTRQGSFNRVIATGENTGETAVARGVATDDNPASPTYYFGGYGRVPRFFRSQFIVTDEQASDAAAAMLARELGTTQSVSFGSLVLPYLEPGDVVTISRALAGIDEDNVIDQLTIPLSAAGTMTGATRATAVTA